MQDASNNTNNMNRSVSDDCSSRATTTGARRDSARLSTTKSCLWDTIIVGSSPLLLLEAAYLGRSGRKVLVLEERGQLGGAWGRLESEEFPYLDIGCHYFDISRRAYEFLRSDVGLNLVPFRPQPRFACRRFLFPYDYRQIIRVARNLRSAFRQRALASFVCNCFHDENYRLRMYPFTKSFLFPRGGSRELITGLTARTQAAEVKIHKHMRAESIRFDSKRNRVQVTAGGETFDGKEIVAGSQARVADALNISALSEGMLRCVFTHVNLVFRDRSDPTFSYLRILGHDAVIRMTDITDHLRYWHPDMTDHRVICIGLRDAYDKNLDDEKKVDQLVAFLKQYRFVSPSATCENSFWSRFPAEFLPDETQKMLQHDFSPMLRLLSTTNFSVGVVSNLDRWETVFG